MNYDDSEGNPNIPATPMMSSKQGVPSSNEWLTNLIYAFVVFGQAVLPHFAIGGFGQS